MNPLHPIQRRILAEDLVRQRRADEERRYAASQRRGRIDANPHQIEAVIFALRRVREGGCLLADEVGLGKTIEAGLVLAQLLAEGMRRALLIVPAALVGQWQAELQDLFGIRAIEVKAEPERLNGEGVFVINREAAGSPSGAELLLASGPFNLCVIDEAHEIFAGIHKRFDRTFGHYRDDSDEAKIAHLVRQVIGESPVLLLTATPIQNSLVELWGLVQYVEPTGTLLGDITTFRSIFCDGDDRTLTPGLEEELRRRLAVVCQRTLRRQAQEFLEKKFVSRQALLMDYRMKPEEKALYDDVTAYLLEPKLCAFRGNQRQLLKLGFHRRMASSLRALAASLQNVVSRLDDMLSSSPASPSRQLQLDFAHDLEEDLSGSEVDEPEDDVPSAETVRAERDRVQQFAYRAESLPHDSKAEKLLEAMALVFKRAREGQGSGRVVIFTETIATQDYLRDLLLEAQALGLTDQDITLFRGSNDSPRALEAYARWQQEIESHMPTAGRPSKHVGIRLALVHEFRQSSKVFISTDAGAKGLNLQFCETLINYDLPWNPQKIEQRIGRCHRYGQHHPVTVINFLATDNEAQRLTFDILSKKLDLFGRVLDASDQVLHEPKTDTPEALANSAVAMSVQKRLTKAFERARRQEDIARNLKALTEDVGPEREAFEAAQERTQSLIQTRLDESIQQAFREIQASLPASLAELDRDLDRLVGGYLRAVGAGFHREEETSPNGSPRTRYRIAPSPRLPDGYQGGFDAVVGHAQEVEAAEPLHLSHPLVLAAVEEARQSANRSFTVRYRVEGHELLRSFAGKRGRLVVHKVGYEGFEPVQRLIPVGVLEGGLDLPLAAGLHLLTLPPEEIPALSPPLALHPDELEDALEEALFLDQEAVTTEAQKRFEIAIQQVERFVEDRALVERRQRDALAKSLDHARERRDKVSGAAAREREEASVRKLEDRLEQAETRLAQLQNREDDRYERCRQRAHDLRYVTPTLTPLLDLEIVLE